MYSFLKKLLNPAGFTQIELIIAMGIAVVLFSIVTINLAGSQRKASLSTEVNKLIADLKDQQIKSMVGDSTGSGANSDYGVYIEPTKYTLFRGSVFNPTDSSNSEIDLPQTIVFTNLGTQIVFGKGSGEISNSTVVILRNTTTNEQKTITVNKYGVVTAIN